MQSIRSDFLSIVCDRDGKEYNEKERKNLQENEKEKNEEKEEEDDDDEEFKKGTHNFLK